jgi:carbon-monoxide dehydrogenase large subunit
MKFGIGQPVPRKEDPRFLTGRGRFVDDIELPRIAHGYVLRSPHAHARFKSIDTKRAQQSPGVLTVLTGEDYAADGLGEIHCHFPVPLLAGPPAASPYPALARGAVKCVGVPVAFIVAEKLAQAKDAAELIDVDYEILPAVVTPDAAARPGAPKVWEHAKDNVSFTIALGDAARVDAAFAAAKHVAKTRLVNNRITTNSIEPRGAIGTYDPGNDTYTLYHSGQAPHVERETLANEIFHVDDAKIRVISNDVGGGFGMKGGTYPEDILVLWAARRLHRNVKWIGERIESIASDAHARDQVLDVEMAFDQNDRITALRANSVYGAGAYLSPTAAISPMFAVTLSSGVYAIPAIRASARGVFTNTASTAPYRGAGRPEASYMLERLIDIAAREMGKDPIELRRKNFVKPSQMPYQTALAYRYDCGDFETVMDRTLKAADWNGFAARRAEAEKRGRLRGRGIACYLEAATIFNERMEIRFNPAGTVSVVAGTFSHGQGHETVYAQMVAEFLGVEFDSVRLIQGDTDAVSFGRGTYASRSISLGGAALRIASDRIVEKGKEIAGFMMEAAPGDVEFKEGKFIVKGTDKSVPIVAVAKRSYVPMGYPAHLGVGLEAVGEFDMGPGNFPNGCQIAEVEIDPDTGAVSLERMSITDDVGTVINPLLLEGQMHGGVAQGVGQALCENITYDSASGQLVSASFLDYCMPRADDLPSFHVDVHPIPTGTNPLGAKGAGETGTVGAPAAVMNAIADALASRGKPPIDMPATPERVWRALHG